jgi:hypothetical protein
VAAEPGTWQNGGGERLRKVEMDEKGCGKNGKDRTKSRSEEIEIKPFYQPPLILQI